MARQRTGRGQRVDVSLLGSQIWAQASEYTFYLSSGELPGRPNRGHPMIAGLYGIMPTADGWIAIVGVAGPNKPIFYDAIGRPDLTDDPRFDTPLLSKPQKAELFGILAEVFVERTTAEWCTILAAAGQRYAPVRNYAEVADDPQVWENGYLVEVDGVRTVGSPLRLSDTPDPRRRRRRPSSAPTRSTSCSPPASRPRRSPTSTPPAPSDRSPGVRVTASAIDIGNGDANQTHPRLRHRSRDRHRKRDANRRGQAERMAVGPNVHLHVGHQNAWCSSVPHGAWTSTAVVSPSPSQRSPQRSRATSIGDSSTPIGVSRYS